MNPSSHNILDRQAYALILKKCIDTGTMLISSLESLGLDLKATKEVVKELKIKLSNYDVYNQKVVYKCPVCKEADCVCVELQITKDQPIISSEPNPIT